MKFVKTNSTDVPNSRSFKVCLHGFLITTGKTGLIAFDLNKEVFVCDIKLPVNTSGARPLYSYYDQVVVFKDSIAVINSWHDGPDRINLWTLDDEACLRDGGVQASWTLKLNIGLDVPFYHVQSLYNSVDLLLFHEGRWFLYNLDTNVRRYIYSREFTCFEEDFFKYTESLLSFSFLSIYFTFSKLCWLIRFF